MTGHDPKVIRLAAAALYAAVDGADDKAARYVARIAKECPRTGLVTAMMGWCDSYVAHAIDDAQPDPASIRVAYMNVETGALAEPGSDTVPANVQWAGRLLTARAKMDEAGFRAAIAELPDGDVAPYIWAVLHIAAQTLRIMPRGFARMGRTNA